jgi:hypothetical protein
MSLHDQMCPMFNRPSGSVGDCQCTYIADIRSDERMRSVSRILSLPKTQKLSVKYARNSAIEAVHGGRNEW